MNKVSVKRQRKEKIMVELMEKFNKAQAVVFANYQGMTHHQIEGLKKSLRNANAELVVAKNTLLLRSLDQKNWKLEDNNVLEGPTITLFAYADIVAPLKELAKTIKLLKLPIIKVGILDSKALSASEVLKLSTLPTREVLLAQLVFTMKAPIYGLHRALNWNVQKLVMTLSDIQQSKS